MANTNAAFLESLGFVPVFYVADIATVALLEGIFISLFSISTSTFMRRGLVSRPAWAIFILSIISFIVATFFACLIVRTVVHIQHVLVDSNDQVILREINIHSSKTLYILNLTSVWCWAVLSTINDIVIVWRTRVLFPETRWVMIGPSFVLLATIASTYTYVGYTVKFILFNPGDVDQRTVKALLVSRYHMIVTTDALSLTTNAVATSLIAFKLWSHRRFIVKNLGHGGRWSRVQSVLFLLVESGLVSGGIQLINLIFEATPRLRQSLPKQILSSALPGLTGMYPTIVAVLAHRRRSSTDTYGFSDMNISHGGGINTRTRSRSTVIGHLTFASPVPGLVTSDVRAFPVAVQDPLSRYDGSEDEARLENALTKQEDNGLGHCVPSTISS
ncbi:hypothetical protein Hypma_001902 [Hypsizygus marmoreus]|uniref:Uncharacterized protein n=1 Tax=Hypsizygus marmoreus TaxID=39966 RepID=A0A369JE24_HYPMA|nr:hypothetical protein Hypma_001902 [Hypsizygus marmoreus]